MPNRNGKSICTVLSNETAHSLRVGDIPLASKVRLFGSTCGVLTARYNGSRARGKSMRQRHGATMSIIVFCESSTKVASKILSDLERWYCRLERKLIRALRGATAVLLFVTLGKWRHCTQLQLKPKKRLILNARIFAAFYSYSIYRSFYSLFLPQLAVDDSDYS